MLIDTHLHLHEPYMQEDRLDKVIENIEQNKILSWVQSCDLETHKVILEVCKRSKYLFPSFGVLPWYAHKVTEQYDLIEKLCGEAIMLGEIGLDKKYAREEASHPHQLPLFEIFLREAEKNNKIMNCHFRGDERGSFEVVKSYKAKKIIFHGYSGEPDLMKEINDLGYYYSLGPRAQEWKVLDIPDDLLLLEIDVLSKNSPRLSSDVFKIMLERFAEIKGTTPEEIEAINQRNVLRLIKDDSNLKEMVDLILEKK
ncbi:MAG: TatD family hydrolase [Candidatus Heimdallarchaeota archaeon]